MFHSVGNRWHCCSKCNLNLIYYNIRNINVNFFINFAKHLENHLKQIKNRTGDSDFSFISLIRFLHLAKPSDDNSSVIKINNAKKSIFDEMYSFPFWPQDDSQYSGIWKNNKEMDKLVFWSENHLLMTLTSCYLFSQYKWQQLESKHAGANDINIAYKKLTNSIETKILTKYLEVHCNEKFGGLYETNSFVYIPYSICALLNLIDFAVNPKIKELSRAIIDNAVYRLMLGTTVDNGVCNLTGTYNAI